MLTEPTGQQREAFHLIGAPIPLTLKPEHPSPRTAELQVSDGIIYPTSDNFGLDDRGQAYVQFVVDS